MSVADEMKDVTNEVSDVSKVQRSLLETGHSDQTEALLHTRARNNLHFILCISPVNLINQSIGFRCGEVKKL